MPITSSINSLHCLMTNLSNPCFLVADIGGTNARFALADQSRQLHSLQVLPCEAYASMDSAIRHYLSQVGTPLIQDAVIAIATPILGDQVKMTNHHWAFSIEATRQLLGFRTLLVVNDFAALAMSLPFLGNEGIVRLDQNGIIREGVKAVIGPGTGLGIAGLIPQPYGWNPLPTEGGHVDFAPNDELEIEILRLLWRDYPHVSPERLVSGPGIVSLYRALRTIAGLSASTATPAEVVERAVSGSCATAAQTLKVFSGMLGSVAGNAALMMNSVGGVYIGGGVISKLGASFDPLAFRNRFVAKGRFEKYLEAIPNYLIVSEYPAFIGAVELLSQFLAVSSRN
jgi:glucokinase